jgi:hypothetical protein
VRLNFEFFTDSVSELYGQRMHKSQTVNAGLGAPQSLVHLRQHKFKNPPSCAVDEFKTITTEGLQSRDNSAPVNTCYMQ